MDRHPLELKLPPAVQVLLAWLGSWLLARYLPIIDFQFPYQTTLAIALLVMGLLIITLCGLGFFKRKTTVDPRCPDQTSALVVVGFYRYSRNPMYVGFLLMVIAAAIYLGAVSGLLMIPLFVLYMNRFQIIPEERFLAEKFGDEFVEYKSRVRRWL